MTKIQIPRKFGITTTAITMLLLLVTSTIPMGQIPHANAALAHSMSVAYVFDFGTGVCDTSGPGSGSSVFVNAVDAGGPPFGGGPPPAGCPSSSVTYTTGSNGFGTTAGGNAVTFTNVAVSTIDAGGVTVLAPYDTVLMYEVCDIAAHPSTMTAINSYLSAGGNHKLVILDGDRCSPLSAGSADYSTFLFPFTSSNPGPSGFTGTITSVESEPAPAVLTRTISTGFVGFPADAIGDSNTFTSPAGGWCAAQMGTNGLGVGGIQTGYVRTATGGLGIWNGWDNWFTFGPTALNAQMFDNIIDQPFNPDSLPCGIPVTGIKLDPLTATNPTGSSHTVTATVTDSTGSPKSGITVTFTVSSGPNAGLTGTAVTDASGHATFTYSDTVTGTDTIVATFTDATSGLHTSGTVSKIWIAAVVPLAITAPPNISVNTDPNLCSASPSLGTATATGGVPPYTITSGPSAPFAKGTTTVTWTVKDSATPTPNTATATQTVTVTDNQPPTITAPPAITVQQGASSSTIGTATGSDNCPGVTITNNAPATFSTFGTVTVTWTATDSSGNKATATQLVTVNAPPVCSKAAASLPTLWPPNHKMHNINILGVTDPDGDVTTITITSIFQDEPVSGPGSGHTAPDGTGVGTSTASVLAERAGTGDGRTYHIGFSANDGNGGMCTGTALVVVPHDQSQNHPEVDQGALFDSTIP